MSNLRWLKKADGATFSVNKKTGCWNFRRFINVFGYGLINRGGKTMKAHRYFFLRSGRKIPKGLQIDHLCNNTKCVNPNHMKAVSQYDNIMRGNGACALNSRKTICKNGHALVGKNVKVYKEKSNGRPRRRCVPCSRADDKRFYYKEKAAREYLEKERNAEHTP